MSPEAKVRDQRTSNDQSAELYCDDDISLKERLTRAESVSKVGWYVTSHYFTVCRPEMPYQQKIQISLLSLQKPMLRFISSSLTSQSLDNTPLGSSWNR